jgi:hypothetical protein
VTRVESSLWMMKLFIISTQTRLNWNSQRSYASS